MPPPRSRRRADGTAARSPPPSSTLAVLRATAIAVAVVGSSPLRWSAVASPSSVNGGRRRRRRIIARSSPSSSAVGGGGQDEASDPVPLDERCLAMSERLFRKMSERADAPPSWNGTLLPAMTCSFYPPPPGDVDDRDRDAEVPAHEGRGRRLALRWLVDGDGSSSVLSPREYEAGLLQRYALAAIYYSTGGDAWTRCSAHPGAPSSPCEGGDDARFLSSKSHLGWGGIVGRGGEVTMLDLGGRGLASRTFLPPELSLLGPSLELLWAHDNPGLGGTLPSYVGEFANLVSLSAFRTSMSGTIPPSACDLPRLASLRLYGSNFGGEVPSEIGRLAGLKWLWLHDNDFVGTVPGEIGGLARLEGVTLHGNGFRPVASYNVTEYGALASNIIPDSLCNLTRYDLRYLWTDCEGGSLMPAVTADGGGGNGDGGGEEETRKFVAREGVRACSCCTRCFPRKDDADAAVAVIGR